MATHSSTLAWEIPWTEKPGKLQPMGSQSRARLSDFTSPHLTFLFLVRPTATSQACHTGAQGAEGATQLLARGSSLAFVGPPDWPAPVPSPLGQLHSGGRAGGEDSPQWGLASPQLREEAWKGFATLDDPLTTLLDMLEASRGCGGRGPSLEAWVARELERWLQAQPRPEPAQVSPTLCPRPVPESHPF